MTEKTPDPTYSVLDDMDDLELITRMLNGQLDPARVEAVRRRLAEDAEFRDLAAPLLLTWSVPPHIERNPRPEGEWERDWARLQQRLRVDIPAAAPAPAPTRGRWGIGRITEITVWSVLLYVVLASFATILWFDLIKPRYFPDPTDGYVAPSGVVAPSTAPR